MIFNTADEKDKEDLLNYIQSFIDSKQTIEVKKVIPNRTQLQNRYLHSILSTCAVEYGDTIYYFKQYIWKVIINPDLFIEQDIETGKTRIKSSSELNKTEMAISIERLKKWAAINLGVYIPELGETGAINYLEEINSKFVRYT